MATEREKEFTDFGFKAPDYKRSQFSVRQSLEQRLQTIGVDPTTIGTTASKQVEDPEDAKRAENAKKTKTEEKPAAATSVFDEEEEKEYALPADFLAEPAPAVNVGYKLTLVDEAGKIKPLFPRENVNKPAAPTPIETIDEKDLPTDEKQRALVLDALKIKRDQKIKEEFERSLYLKQIEAAAANFQKSFEESMRKLPLPNPLTTAELDDVDKGVWDAVRHESLPGLKGMSSLLSVAAKASEAQVASHSKLKTVHEMNIALAERNKALQREKKEKEQRIAALEAQMAAIHTTANTPRFLKQEERIKPAETSAVSHSSVTKSEAKRQRDEETVNPLDPTTNSIFDQILAQHPDAPVEHLIETARNMNDWVRKAGGYTSF